MRDEQAARRADFVEGASVRLADGQIWTLPERLAEAPDPDYDAILNAVFETENATDRLRAELALTIFLLGRNYHLTPDDFQAILGFGPDDPNLAETQRAIHAWAVEQVRSLHAPNPAIEPSSAGVPQGIVLGLLNRLRSRLTF